MSERAGARAGDPPEARAAAPPALDAALARPDVRRLRASLAARPGAAVDPGVDPRPPRLAAVALVLRVGDGGAEGPLELLFVKRAEYERDPWSGQVAFPGGRREEGDATPWDTAARETREETGLDLRRDGRLLGTLDELHPRTSALPSIIVRPHVVVAAPTAALELSEELAAAFWVPVRRLAEPEASTSSTVRARGVELRVPSFVHDGHTIWGMTHRIVQQFLERLADGGR